MAALVCELCGSNDLVKQDGLFVCQHCGTKYTVDEARKLLENGVVRVTVDNSPQLEKILSLADDAFKDMNYEASENYYSQAIEVEPQNASCLFRHALSELGRTGFENGVSTSIQKQTQRAIEIMKDIEDTEVQQRIVLKSLLDLYRVYAGISNALNSKVFSLTMQSINATSQTTSDILSDIFVRSSIEVTMNKNIRDNRAYEIDKQTNKYRNNHTELDAFWSKTKGYLFELASGTTKYSYYYKDNEYSIEIQQPSDSDRREIMKQCLAENPDNLNELLAEKQKLIDKKAEKIKQKEQIALTEDYERKNIELASLKKKFDELGMFKFKERNETYEKISALSLEIAKMSKEYNKKRDKMDDEIKEIDKRIKEIDSYIP